MVVVKRFSDRSPVQGWCTIHSDIAGGVTRAAAENRWIPHLVNGLNLQQVSFIYIDFYTDISSIPS